MIQVKIFVNLEDMIIILQDSDLVKLDQIIMLCI